VEVYFAGSDEPDKWIRIYMAMNINCIFETRE
jgi:hypothetical protein